MKFHILVVLLFACLLHGNAQAPALKVKYFSKNDGLNSSFINCVAQDSTGFLWVGTRDGLFKYNGYGFTGYFHKLEDSTTLIYNNISYLFTDSKKRLWIGTTLGLCLYDEKKDHFIRLAEEHNSAGLNTITIVQITEDEKGTVLINTGTGIFGFNEKNEQFFPVLADFDAPIHYILPEKGYLWLACSGNKGLIKYDIKTGNKKTVVGNLNILKITKDKEKIWLATLGQGIQSYNQVTGQIQQIPFQNNDDRLAINVIKDKSDNIWSIDFTGLKFINKAERTFTAYYPMPEANSIKGNIKGIFQDRQGNYWFYHEPGGLGVSLQLKGFHHYNSYEEAPWLTSGNNVTSLCEDHEGSLWIGYHEGGVDVFKWNEGKVVHFTNNERDKYSIGRGTVLCMLMDSKKRMWVGTFSGGLHYYDEKLNRFITYSHNPSDSTSIAGNDIRSIAEDSEGNLWLAVHAKGIDKLDLKTGKAIHFNNAHNKLSNDWTFQVLIDQNEDIWVATAWGLDHLKKGEKIFRPYLSDPHDTGSLANNLVTTLHLDNHQVLWVGTSAGLCRFNPKSRTFTKYIDRFESNYITGILSDRHGNLWISTLAGISKMAAQFNSVNNFSTSDGLVSGEFNLRAVYKNSKNELFFGGTGGVDVFNPEKLRMNPLPPNVIIDKILIFNQELTVTNSDKLKNHIAFTKKIRLSYNDKVITLHFKALNFINPSENQYAYKLEGFDEKWHFAGELKEATYTNLDPGKYVFSVMASNNDGVWNKKGARLEIVISPPWYGTVVFKTLVFLIVVLLILLYVHIRTSKLTRQRILLEKTVKEKTFELSEKNKLLKVHSDNLNEANQLLIDRQKQLQRQSEELKLQSDHLIEINKELQTYNVTKDKLFSIIAHDLISPFNTIIGFSEMLRTRYDDLSEEERRKYIEIVNTSSERVYSLLHSLLLWSRAQTNRISYNPEKVKVKPLIKEALQLSSGNLKSKLIRTEIECPVNATVWADNEMFKIIIRNILNNAIKFTPRKGRIRLEVETNGDQVQIAIIDNGIGMIQSKIDELTSAAIISSEQGTDGEAGSGLGISLCRDFIKKNKGEFSISSEIGKGSTFTITLPAVK